MFRLMRNIHLILGLVLFFFSLLFAVSSLTFIYRPWLPKTQNDQEYTVQISAGHAANPRALALELMRNHGLKGDLRQIKENDGEISFAITRPGTKADVKYAKAAGEARIKIREHGFLDMLLQLHTNHGFWHEFLPANAWALLSLLGSIGMLLLGGTGIYLWFTLHEERVIGSILLGLGLTYALTTLVLSRIA